MSKGGIEAYFETYMEIYDDDIMALIEAIRDIEMYTKDGADVKRELLNILYYEA